MLPDSGLKNLQKKKTTMKEFLFKWVHQQSATLQKASFTVKVFWSECTIST